MENIIKEIDDLIEKDFKNSGENYLNKLSTLIQNLNEVENFESYNNFLFNRENGNNIQRFISFCFIRILGGTNYQYLEKVKHQVLTQIIESLPDLCNLLGVNYRTETYQQEKIFRDFIKERDFDLSSNLCFNGEIISDLKVFQQNYRRTCNNKKNIILHAFVGDLLSRSTLDIIFNRMNEYLESTEESRYEVFCSLNKIIEQHIEEANVISTRYTKDYIVNPFTKIKEIIHEDIEKSPFYIPAFLEIYTTEKKYPLSEGIKYNFDIGITNKGKGYAQNVNIKISDFDKDNISIQKTERFIGNIKFENTVIEFEYEVLKEINSIVLEVEITWNSSDNERKKYSDIIELFAQANNINWEEIKQNKPYNLEPVETEPDLIGRDKILQKLRGLQTLPLGSSYIYGQRRVGKTSIVKTLLNSNNNPDLLILYIEAGDWNDANDAGLSMNNLGEKICNKIKRHNLKFKSIPVPDFKGSFNKITDFLEDVEQIDSNFKLLIILDEFDRISRKLYERGDTAQSFILTLRSISNKSQFGFILVGGEKLEYILSQWQEFNKFSPIRVDYFSKEEDLDDFRKLIQKPVENIFEFTDSAINAIYEETAGNPYFTKKICMELFILMIRNRDTHITDKEAQNAAHIARSSANIGATDFSHFWEDGIKGKFEKEEETSIKRRKLLILITEIMFSGEKLNKDKIIDKGFEIGLKQNDIDKYLIEFEQRKILHSNKNEYSFVVRFFKKWLLSGGVEKIVATFEEEERILINQKLEENQKIKTEEILNITNKPLIYKGKEITSDEIRKWISQFDDIIDQRIIFKILQNFKLYTELDIRQCFKTLYTSVKKEFKANNKVRILDSQKKKRDDIIVSYLDNSPAKGGSYFIKLFADENSIYFENACTPNNLEKRISEKNNINILLIIDDFIGSGGTMIKNIDNYFTEDFCKSLNEKKIITIFGAVTGYLEAKEKIQQKIDDLKITAKVLIIDVLNESDKCFCTSSTIFANNAERKRAESICKYQGGILEPKAPLGFSDCQSLIAFPLNCPNNTLPIFWKKTEQWMPIFERK